MKQVFLSFLVAFLVFSSVPSAQSGTLPPTHGKVLKVQKRTMDLLLKIRGVLYVTTASCDALSGELKTNRSSSSSETLMECIAVRLRNRDDVVAVEAVYDNPLELDGVLIHFTDEETTPNKGGITVHN